MNRTAEHGFQKSLRDFRLRRLIGGIRDSAGRFSGNKLAVAGAALILLFCLMAVLHPILLHSVLDPGVYDPLTPIRPNPPPNPAPPSAAHWLGTDPFGNDILSQLMYGAGSALLLGLTAAAVTAVLATGAGAAAAYFGGAVDGFLMRLSDLILMTPLLVVLIFLSALFDLPLAALALCIGIFSGLGASMLMVKAQALSIRNRPYIDSARAVGGGDGYILFRHLVPQLAPVSLLYVMFTVTEAVFSESALSYFGLIRVKITWGMMIHIAAAEGYLLRPDVWWLVLPAALCITLFCSAFYFTGRGLERAVNPGLRIR